MMATEVESCKADPIDGELLGCGVQCGYMLRHTVILQHVEQRCLACIVQSKEQQFPRFLPEAEVAQCSSDPLPQEHGEAQPLMNSGTCQSDTVARQARFLATF